MSRKDRIEWVEQNLRDQIVKLIGIEKKLESKTELDVLTENITYTQLWDLENEIIDSIMAQFYCRKITASEYLRTAKRLIKNESAQSTT